MDTVSFTRMEDGTVEDWALIESYESEFFAELPDRILAALEKLKDSFGGYQVTRYTHSLQAATRALRDGRDEEYVVATLVHDIGDDLAPYTHGEMVAAVLKPFVREELCWMVKHHGVFQLRFFSYLSEEDRNRRDDVQQRKEEEFRGHEEIKDEREHAGAAVGEHITDEHVDQHATEIGQHHNEPGHHARVGREMCQKSNENQLAW